MIEIIAGTNRPGSNTLKVATAIKKLYEEQGVEVGLFSLEDLPPEIFDPSSYAQKPASFKPIQDRILKADGLHVVTPEYNGGFPGVLKYFIDMLKFPESFEARPVAFTGVAAGIWGAIRPIEMLQLIFGYRNAYFYPKRVFFPGVNDKLDDAGAVKPGAELDLLKDQVSGFAAFVEKHKEEPSKEV